MSCRKTYYIPKKCQSQIIGKGASILKDLQQQYDVKISVPKAEDASTAVVIAGDAEDNIKAAKAAIEAILGFKIGTAPLQKIMLDIQSTEYGMLIGKGGSILADLEKKFAVNLYIPKSDEKDAAVEVEGPAKGVTECMEKIGTILKKKPRVVNNGKQAGQAPKFVADLSKPIADSLFFPDDNIEDGNNFDKFIGYLSSAKKTIDICVFTISDDRVSDVLMRLHDQGVKIRVISDNETSTNQGSDIEDLRKAGLEVKLDKSDFHMHHKFAVVDKHLLLNGSYNWTRTAATSNCENIMVTNAKEFVEAFIKHFDFMWNNHDAFA